MTDLQARPVVGADVGGTRLRLGAWNGRELSRTVSMPCAGSCRALADALNGYIAENCPNGVSAVSLGIPGTLDRERRRVIKTPNLALSGEPLAEKLEAALGVPVLLDNDVNMLMRGDMALLGRGRQGVTLGIYIGTGLGGGIFVNGEPLPGRNGISEIGHVPMAGRGDRCTCGGVGCAENYVSGRRLLQLRDALDPGCDIAELFVRHGRELGGFIDDLAVVAGGAITLIDPALVIIGGGVAAMRGFPAEEAAAAIRDRCMKPVPSATVEFAFSGNEPGLGVLGAALAAAGTPD